MAVTFERIEADFCGLRDFILNDLERIVGQEVGGNFAVATLVAVGHEEIARLRYERPEGELSFRETLSPAFQPLARALYGALRDGLVHSYRMQTIRYDGERAEVGIAWRGGHHEHHTLTLEGGEEADGIFLSAPRLVADLRREFDRLEADLRADPGLRGQFLTRRRKDRERFVTGPEAEAWRELLRKPD